MNLKNDLKFIKITTTFLFTLIINIDVAHSSYFSVQNDTGVPDYKVTSIAKYDNVEYIGNFRLRATFHKSAKDLEWLNANCMHVNKVYLPKNVEEWSDSKLIYSVGDESSLSQYVTLYLTADMKYHDEDETVACFPGAKTHRLKAPEFIQSIGISFKKYNINSKKNMFDAKIRVNGIDQTLSSTQKNTKYIKLF